MRGAEPHSGRSPARRRILAKEFLWGNAIVFADSMCIRIFEDRVRPSQPGTDWASGDYTKNFSGQAQTFVDLMGISRYRGRMAVPRVKKG